MCLRVGGLIPGQTTKMEEVRTSDEPQIVVHSEEDTEPFTIGEEVHITAPASHVKLVKRVIEAGLRKL